MYDLKRRLARLNDDRSWHGMLCRDTTAAVAARVQRMIGDRPFTVVTANSYDENSNRYSAVDVRTSEWLTEPVRADLKDDYFGFTIITPNMIYGLHNFAITEQEARDGGKHRYVHLNFDDRNRALTVDQYAPAGYKLQWTFMAEDHQWFQEWREDRA